MKKLAALLMILGSVGIAHAQVAFSFHTSRIGSMYKMLQHLSEQNNHHPYYSLADSSRLYTPAIRAQVACVGNLSWETFKYQSQPKSRQIGRGTQEFFLTAAYQSATLAELRQRTTGYLPLKEQEQVLAAMRAIAPVFDALVWQRCAARADSQTAVLQAYANSRDLNTFFKRAIVFFGAATPDTLDYRVYINPLPPGINYFTANPMQSLLITDMPYKARRWDDLMSVIFHEVCHVLYAEQPTSIQYKLDSAFLPNRGPNRFKNGLAYQWLDEALATAVGNGAFYKHLTGRLDTNEWYNNTTINTFSHALYPTVAQWLEQGKSISNPAFADTAVSLFYKGMPNGKVGTEQLLPFHVLIADSLPGGLWDQAMGRRIRRRYAQTIYPIDNHAYETMESWHGLGIVIIFNKQAAEWAKVSKRLSDIFALTTPAKRQKVGKKGAWYVFAKGKSGRPWLLINPKDQQDVAATITQIGNEVL